MIYIFDKHIFIYKLLVYFPLPNVFSNRIHIFIQRNKFLIRLIYFS